MRKGLYLCIVFCISLAFVAEASAVGRLFRTNEPTDRIEELNPDTGGVIRSFPTPIQIGDGCSGLAFAVNRLFFVNCDSDIYELNPTTGAVINSFPSPSPTIDGLGFSGNELFLQDYSGGAPAISESNSLYGGASGTGVSPKIPAPAGGKIYVLNPNTGELVRTLNTGVPLEGGLTYAGGRNSLFASGMGGIRSTAVAIEPGSIIYEINPSTGAIINSFSAPVAGIFGLGYSFARTTLFLGDVGESGANTIYEVNPSTGEVIHTLPVVPNWSLAADENGAASVPTMNEWGLLLFIAFAGIGSVYFLRRQRRA